MKLHRSSATSSAGFLSIEALLAVALCGVMVLIAMSVTGSYSAATQTINSRQDSYEIARKLEMLLADKDFCTQNIVLPFTGPEGFEVSQIAGGLKIEHIRKGNYNLYSAAGGGELQKIAKITDLSIFPANGNAATAVVSTDLYVGELRIRYDLGESSAKDSIIPFLMKTNGGLVQSCQIFPDGVTSTVMLTGCKVGQFVKGVDSTGAVSCIDFPASQCPPGQRLVGLNHDASPRCVSFPKTP